MHTDETRIDAMEKVTGKALYTDDLKLPGMLYVKEIHCPYPHARINNIDFSAALDIPGVRAVLTASDLPKNQNTFDQPILADEEALHADEAVALVVAETEQIAHKAARRVKISYTQLPSVHNIKEATAEDAPRVHKDGNIACTCVMKQGVACDFSGCDYVVEHDFSTQRMHHGSLEPDCVVAVPTEEGLEILGGSKGPFNTRSGVAQLLKIPEEKIRVRHMTIGGGFGGRMCDTILLGARAGAAALKTGQPCKLIWTREETLSEGTKRHPFEMKVKLGANKEGKLIAASFVGFADAGAYLLHTKGVVFRAMVECLGPYSIENLYVNIQGVYTNMVSSDAVRGFGTPQVGFAMECAIDMLAMKIGLSPYCFRMKNILKEGDRMASGQTAECVGISHCGDELGRYFDLEQPSGYICSEKNKAYGWGLSFMLRGESHGALSRGRDYCGIDLDITHDRRIKLSSSVSELGQGAYTAQAIALSKILGVPKDCIFVQGADTGITPPCTTTSGSRGTISGVNAVWLACQDLINSIKVSVASHLAVPMAQVQYANGRFYSDGGGVLVNFWDAVNIHSSCGGTLHFEGRWKSPDTYWDWEKHRGEPYYSYSYGVAAAKVEIDMVSGHVEILDLVVLNDLGNIVNYREAEAQIAGGIMMSVGFALMEEVLSNDGVIETRNFDKYIMPTAVDLVGIRAIPTEFVPASNPMGVHGVGEMSASVAAPAIANAVRNALGVFITDLPLSLERIKTAVLKRNNRSV